MESARAWASGVIFGIAAVGCSTTDVSVGAEGAALNMSQCFATDCKTLPATTRLADAPFEVCAATGGRYHVVMTQNYAQRLCPVKTDDGTPNCSISLAGSASAPDRSLWILLTLRVPQPDAGQYWLQHYADDGTLVGSRLILDVPGEQFYGNRADLVVDQNGDAWVGLYRVDAGPDADSSVHEAIWVGKYDASTTPLLTPIPLQGIARPRLATAAGQGIAIVGDAFGNANRALMSLLDPNGLLLWTQTVVPSFGANTGDGVTGATMDRQGQVAVLSERDRGASNTKTLGLTRVGADGRVLWDAKLPREFSAFGTAALLEDDAGRLIVAGALLDSGGIALGMQPQAYVSYGPNGESPRISALDTSYLGVPSIDRVTGTVYVPQSVLAGGTALANMAEIAPNGAPCVTHEIQGAYPMALVARGEGSLYYITNDSIGRIEPDPLVP